MASPLPDLGVNVSFRNDQTDDVFIFEGAKKKHDARAENATAYANRVKGEVAANIEKLQQRLSNGFAVLLAEIDANGD